MYHVCSLADDCAAEAPRPLVSQRAGGWISGRFCGELRCCATLLRVGSRGMFRVSATDSP
jgi:hypothetical protein